MLYAEDPLEWIERRTLGCRAAYVELGIYRYHPGSASDDRRITHVEPERLRTTVKQLAATLRTDEELAIHSRVYFGGSGGVCLHMPLLDLHGIPTLARIRKLAAHMRQLVPSRPFVVSSGRSCHAYFEGFLDNDGWRKFLGLALLANRVDSTPIVDWRWIAHGLLAGFSSLRLTCNTKQYAKLPTELLPSSLVGAPVDFPLW